MSSTPLVSVVTPSYNTGRYVGDAVRSVLSQDYRNVEYLVMDGGSTDNTVAELKKFGPRCQWVSQRDHGQTDALNKGFVKSTGQILAWLNSDDTYAPGAINTAVEFLWSNPDVAVVYGDAHFIDAEGKFIARCAHTEPFDPERLRHYSDFIVQPTAFFRRSAFEAVGGLDPGLHWCMDYDLWLKMAAKGFKFAYLPKHLANYRWLAGTKTASGGWPRLRELEAVAARYGDGTHAYHRLEAVNLHLQEAAVKLRRLNPFGTTASLFRAARTYLTSARAVRSTFQLRTWKIIYTGQVLRKRALADAVPDAKGASGTPAPLAPGSQNPSPGRGARLPASR